MKIYPDVPKYSHLNAVFFKFDDEQIFEIKSQSENFLQEMQNINSVEQKNLEFNHNLVGHLEKQYKLKQEIIGNVENKLKPVLNEYHKRYLSNAFNTSENICIDNSWINFQKKYEYNPPHMHSGLLSFVIWVTIPYNYEDESNFDNCKKTSKEEKSNGTFLFLHPQQDNSLSTPSIGKTQLLTDKTWEGRGVMFPAKLVHMVHPFYTSDDYRISISGNYSVK